MYLLRIWGGVEWGMGMLTTCTCSHGRCYATYTGGVGWSVGMFKEEEEEVKKTIIVLNVQASTNMACGRNSFREKTGKTPKPKKNKSTVSHAPMYQVQVEIYAAVSHEQFKPSNSAVLSSYCEKPFSVTFANPNCEVI